MVQRMGRVPARSSRAYSSFQHLSLQIFIPDLISCIIEAPPGGTFDDLQDYAHRLLASFPEPGSGVRIKLPPEHVRQSEEIERDWERKREREEERLREREREREDEGGLTGCREAVEILTRNPKKGMF